MSYQKVFKGEEWAWLKCVDIKKKKVYTPWPRGGGGETVETVMLILECECGNKFQIEQDKFSCKRKFGDCGCGGSTEEVITKPKTIVMPLKFMREIDTYAKLNFKGNFSKAIVKFAKAGFKAELDKPKTVDSVVA